MTHPIPIIMVYSFSLYFSGSWFHSSFFGDGFRVGQTDGRTYIGGYGLAFHVHGGEKGQKQLVPYFHGIALHFYYVVSFAVQLKAEL